MHVYHQDEWLEAMKRENVGQIRIIEAILALLIVFSAFTISSDLTATESTSKHNELASIGLQCLAAMDSTGSLTRDIDAGNWTKLQDAVAVALPSGFIFNLSVMDENLRQINSGEMSNGGLGNLEVTCVEYICVSRNSSLKFYVLRLCLVVVE